jgi:hypothetical protein
VGIDNDHAFVRAITTNQGTRELQVKCVLFCFDAMRKPVHSAVRERILALSPDAFLEEWLTQLDDYQNQSMRLFDKKARKQLFKSTANALKVALGQARERLPVVVTIPFRPKAITELWDRFSQLQEVLRKQPTITHLQLLKRVTPALGVRYEEAFELYEEPNEVAKRFHDIAKTHYSTAIAGRYATLTTSKQALEAMGLSDREQKALVNDKDDKALSPEAALNELRQTMAQKAKIKSIIEGIHAGEFELFRQVPSLQLKEFILAQLDFSRITLANSKEPDIKKQEALLKIIITENTAFQSITLQHCAALTDDHVITLLKNSPGLRKLKLVDCPQLTGKIGAAIEKYAPTVVSLTLLRLPQVLFIGTKVKGLVNRKVEYQPINLQHLTRVNISEMLQLEHLVIQCSQLTLATTKRNPQLSEVTLLSERLEAWDLSYCDAMGDEALVTAARGCKLIRRLNIQGCRRIQSPLFHHISAQLPHLFQLLSFKQWQRREDWFYRSATEAVFYAEEAFDVAEMTAMNTLLSHNTALIELDYSHSPMGDETLFSLLDAVQNHPTLKRLKLVLKDLSTTHSRIVEILTSNKFLTSCIINGVNYVVLRHTLFQREAELSLGEEIGSEMFIIAALLRQNPILKILHCSNHWLSTRCVDVLCRGLENNTALEILDVRGCDLNDEAATLLLTLLQKNTTLSFINLDGNPCSEEIKNEVIALCLQRCRQLHDRASLQAYLKGLLDSSEMLDFSEESAKGLLSWAKVRDGFYRGTNVVEVNWLYPAGLEHENSALNSTHNGRAEASLASLPPEPCIATINGHSDSVHTLIQFADDRLVSGSRDKTIKIWNVATGACLATLNGHSGAVWTLTQLADGRLASGSYDESIKLWDMDTQVCLATLEGHSKSVNTLTQLVDGRLASGSDDNAIKLWDVDTNVCLATLEGHSWYVHALTQLDDGRLASGSGDTIIKLWDVLPCAVASFDVAFRFQCAALFSLQKQEMSLVIALLPAVTPSSESLRLLQALKAFVDALLYNCYARNKLLFAVKITIDEHKHRLSVVCPKEELASQLFACLNAFFYPAASLKPFLELLESDKASKASKSEGKMPVELPQGLPPAPVSRLPLIPEVTLISADTKVEPVSPLTSTSQTAQWKSQSAHRRGTFAEQTRNSGTFFGSHVSASPLALSSSSESSSASSSSSSFFYSQPGCTDLDAIELNEKEVSMPFDNP